MSSSARELAPGAGDLLVQALDDGFTGALEGESSDRGLVTVYVSMGEILAAHCDEDDEALLRVACAAGHLSAERAQEIRASALGGGQVSQLLQEHLPSEVLEGLLWERFRENLCLFLTLEEAPRYEELDTVFVDNLQIGHRSRELVGELRAQLKLVATLNRQLGASISPWVGDPRSDDERKILQLCAPRTTIWGLLARSPWERTRTLVHLRMMLGAGLLQTDSNVDVHAAPPADPPLGSARTRRTNQAQRRHLSAVGLTRPQPQVATPRRNVDADKAKVITLVPVDDSGAHALRDVVAAASAPSPEVPRPAAPREATPRSAPPQTPPAGPAYGGSEPPRGAPPPSSNQGIIVLLLVLLMVMAFLLGTRWDQGEPRGAPVQTAQAPVTPAPAPAPAPAPTPEPAPAAPAAPVVVEAPTPAPAAPVVVEAPRPAPAPANPRPDTSAQDRAAEAARQAEAKARADAAAERARADAEAKAKAKAKATPTTPATATTATPVTATTPPATAAAASHLDDLSVDVSGGKVIVRGKVTGKGQRPLGLLTEDGERCEYRLKLPATDSKVGLDRIPVASNLASQVTISQSGGSLLVRVSCAAGAIQPTLSSSDTGFSLTLAQKP